MTRRWTIEEIHAAVSKAGYRWLRRGRGPVDVTAVVENYEAQYKASATMHRFITEELESLPVPNDKLSAEACWLKQIADNLEDGAKQYTTPTYLRLTMERCAAVARAAVVAYERRQLEPTPAPNTKTTEEALKLDADEHRVSCGACRHEWTASREGVLSILGLTTMCTCGSRNICIHGKRVSF